MFIIENCLFMFIMIVQFLLIYFDNVVLYTVKPIKPHELDVHDSTLSTWLWSNCSEGQMATRTRSMAELMAENPQKHHQVTDAPDKKKKLCVQRKNYSQKKKAVNSKEKNG